MEPESRLKGHVDVVDGSLMQGWALNLIDAHDVPIIDVIQLDKVVVSVTPHSLHPSLVSALGLKNAPTNGRYIWRVLHPFSLGISPSVPFTFRFRKTNEILQNGRDRTLERFSVDLVKFSKDVLACSVYLEHRPIKTDGGIRLVSTISNWSSNLEIIKLEVSGHQIDAAIADDQSGQDSVSGRRWFLPGKTVTTTVDFGLDSLTQDSTAHTIHFKLPNANQDSRSSWLNSVRGTVVIPAVAFDDNAVVPEAANIIRISGGSDLSYYWIGGATTLFQLNEIAKKYDGLELMDYQCIVDWGVGCARVMRHFWETPDIFTKRSKLSGAPRLFGFDVDSLNVEWCQRNMMSDMAQFRTSRIVPHLTLRDSSVDYLYGISVIDPLRKCIPAIRQTPQLSA